MRSLTPVVAGESAEDHAGLEAFAPLMARLRARARDLETLLTQRATERSRFAWAGELRRAREDIDALLDALNDARAVRGRAEDAPPLEPAEPPASGSDSTKGLVPTSR